VIVVVIIVVTIVATIVEITDEIVVEVSAMLPQKNSDPMYSICPKSYRKVSQNGQ